MSGTYEIALAHQFASMSYVYGQMTVTPVPELRRHNPRRYASSTQNEIENGITVICIKYYYSLFYVTYRYNLGTTYKLIYVSILSNCRTVGKSKDEGAVN